MACCTELTEYTEAYSTASEKHLEEWQSQWADYNLRANILTGLQVAIGTAGMITGILAYNKMWDEVAEAAGSQKEIVNNILSQQNSVYIPCETQTVPFMCGLHNGAAGYLVALREKLNAQADAQYATFTTLSSILATNLNAIENGGLLATANAPEGYLHSDSRARSHEGIYDSSYQTDETTAMPNMIRNGGAGASQMNSSACTAVESSDTLLTEWRDSFGACEMDTLQRACELWGNGAHPLQRMCATDDKVDDLLDASKLAFEVFLQCEVDYANEICQQERYEPNRECKQAEARAHVEREFTAQRRRSARCISPNNVGVSVQLDHQLSYRQAVAQAAAVQAANRYEDLKVSQEGNRRHRYITDLARLNEAKDDRTIQAAQLSAQINNLKLTFINNVLQRGWNYVDSARGFKQLGQLGFQSNMSAGINAANVGQAHINHGLNWWARRSQALQHAQNVSMRGGTLIQNYGTLAHSNYTTAGLDAQRLISSAIAHLDRMPALLGSGTRAGAVSGGLFGDLLNQASQLASGGLGAIGDAAGQWVIGDLGAPSTTQPGPSQAVASLPNRIGILGDQEPQAFSTD